MRFRINTCIRSLAHLVKRTLVNVCSTVSFSMRPSTIHKMHFLKSEYNEIIMGLGCKIVQMVWLTHWSIANEVKRSKFCHIEPWTTFSLKVINGYRLYTLFGVNRIHHCNNWRQIRVSYVKYESVVMFTELIMWAMKALWAFCETFSW